MRARIPRNHDPLGYGLRSVPEPLQRLWLICQGNPYFEDDAKNLRLKTGVPDTGFSESTEYVDWIATRWKRHGHIAETTFPKRGLKQPPMPLDTG